MSREARLGAGGSILLAALLLICPEMLHAQRGRGRASSMAPICTVHRGEIPKQDIVLKGNGLLTDRQDVSEEVLTDSAVYVTLRNHHPLHLAPFRLVISDPGIEDPSRRFICSIDAQVPPLTAVTYITAILTSSRARRKVDVMLPPNTPVDVVQLAVEVRVQEKKVSSWKLALANIDDRIDVLINGERAFSCGLYDSCSRELERWLVKGGRNIISLRLHNEGGPYHYQYTLYRDGKVYNSDACGKSGDTCTRWGRFAVGTGRFDKEIVTVQLPE